MDIIPAIDIIEGKCVRLTQGDYEQQTIYNERPLEVAKAFEGAGLRRLHLVDLDGAKSRRVKNWKVLELLAGQTSLSIDFGGGITTGNDLDIVLNSGAMFATIGSLAVKEEALFTDWIGTYGEDKFLLGADVLDEQIVVSGWLEKTQIGIIDFIGKYMAKKLTRIFCTDVSRDGLLEGAAVDLYRKILARFPTLLLIASGGVRGMEDITALKELGCGGVIIGKAIYEGRVTLDELSKFQ